MSKKQEDFETLLQRIRSAEPREKLRLLRDPAVIERLRVLTPYTLSSVLRNPANMPRL